YYYCEDCKAPFKQKRMTPNQYKTHFFNVAKRVEKIDKKYNQLAVGFEIPISNFELIGYFHKTRIHRTKLTIKDFAWLRYLIPAGDGIHYAEAELCQRGKVIKKVVVLREKI